MFEITEMQTGIILATCATHVDAQKFIDEIESFDGFENLLIKYESVRRIVQELTIFENQIN